MVQWALANWQTVLLDAVAVDTALIVIFPNAGALKAIGNFLAGISAKKA